MNDDISSELKRLARQHKRIARRIDQFDQQALMTPGEQDERKRLQKLKLSIRDRIASLEQRASEDNCAAGAATVSDEAAEYDR